MHPSVGCEHNFWFGYYKTLTESVLRDWHIHSYRDSCSQHHELKCTECQRHPHPKKILIPKKKKLITDRVNESYIANLEGCFTLKCECIGSLIICFFPKPITWFSFDTLAHTILCHNIPKLVVLCRWMKLMRHWMNLQGLSWSLCGWHMLLNAICWWTWRSCTHLIYVLFPHLMSYSQSSNLLSNDVYWSL